MPIILVAGSSKANAMLEALFGGDSSQDATPSQGDELATQVGKILIEAGLISNDDVSFGVIVMRLFGEIQKANMIDLNDGEDQSLPAEVTTKIVALVDAVFAKRDKDGAPFGFSVGVSKGKAFHLNLHTYVAMPADT